MLLFDGRASGICSKFNRKMEGAQSRFGLYQVMTYSALCWFCQHLSFLDMAVSIGLTPATATLQT